MESEESSGDKRPDELRQMGKKAVKKHYKRFQGKWCAAINCKNCNTKEENKQLSFFRFPSNAER